MSNCMLSPLISELIYHSAHPWNNFLTCLPGCHLFFFPLSYSFSTSFDDFISTPWPLNSSISFTVQYFISSFLTMIPIHCGISSYLISSNNINEDNSPDFSFQTQPNGNLHQELKINILKQTPDLSPLHTP